MHRIAIVAVLGLSLGLSACGGSPDPQSSTSASSSKSTGTTTQEDEPDLPSTYDAEQALSRVSIGDVCTPTQAESDSLDQALMDEFGITKTDSSTFSVAYLAQACDDKKVEAAAKAKAKAVKNPKSYKAISKRALAKVMRNPDAYAGKKYIVYGEVTQFDSATGEDTFRADVAYADIRKDNYGYWSEGENSFITAGAADLSDIVAEDVVKMYVEVTGSFSYDTTMGGTMTVPQFTVNIIKRIGTSE